MMVVRRLSATLQNPRMLVLGLPRHPLARLLLLPALPSQARLWRIIFLQDGQGFFEPTDSLAFALLAISADQVPKREYTGLMKYIQRFQRVNATGAVFAEEAQNEQDPQSAMNSRRISGRMSGRRAEKPARRRKNLRALEPACPAT